MRTEIVPATEAMLERFSQPAKTVRAIAAVRGEEVLGVAGIYPSHAGWVMFAEFKDDIRADKRVMVRGIRALAAMVKRRNMAVAALADPEIQGSSTLLEHMGFQPAYGDVFVWQP